MDISGNIFRSPCPSSSRTGISSTSSLPSFLILCPSAVRALVRHAGQFHIPDLVVVITPPVLTHLLLVLSVLAEAVRLSPSPGQCLPYSHRILRFLLFPMFSMIPSLSGKMSLRKAHSNTPTAHAPCNTMWYTVLFHGIIMHGFRPCTWQGQKRRPNLSGKIKRGESKNE